MDTAKSSSSEFLPTQSVIVESTTVNLSDADEEGGRNCDRTCRVCGHLSHGYHFGILACRACAAFFRRTVVERKSYRCRQSGQCQIRKEMRNMCRSCRFDLCIRLGMNKDDVQMYRDPIGKRNANKNDASMDENGQASATTAAIISAISDSTARSGSFPPQPLALLSSFASSSSPSSHLDAAALGISSTSNGCSLPGGGIGIGINTSSSAATTVPVSATTAATTPTLTTGLLHVALPQPIRPSIDSTSQQQQQSNHQGLAAIAAARRQTLEAIPSASSSSTIALLPCAIPSATSTPSVLQRLVDGYRNFQSAQKSLHTVMYPDNIFSGESYRLVTHSEYVKMERGCISLMYSMLVDCFQPFDSLDQPLKVAALQMFSTRFTHLDQCFRTVALFPENDDPRLVVHYGQYMSADRMEEFFSEHDAARYPETLKSGTHLIHRCLAVKNKMRDMAIRDIEIAALAAIILWNECEHACVLAELEEAPKVSWDWVAYMNVEGTDKVRSAIFAELHNNMCLTYGISKTGLRLGSLLDIIQDLNIIEKELRETVIISKFLMPNFAEVWEDNSNNE